MGQTNSAHGRPSFANPYRSSTGPRVPHSADSDVTLRDKKKKASKFATLRKKLIRVRRQSRSMDYTKVIRDLTSSWDIRDLRALLDDYEALAVLKEFTICANLARPPVNMLRTDLAALFDHSYCADVTLVYQSVSIKSHRAILCIRCSYFRDLLSRYPQHDAQVLVKVRTGGVDVATFTALIRFLYTDELNTTGTHLDNSKVLGKLIDEFGLPNPLEHDMRTLLDLGVYSDAILVFSSEADATPSSADDAAIFSCGNKHELRCHKSILAARSVFFRNLLRRRASLSRWASEPHRILLDESVIPKQYARVLLECVYTDVVDLSCIVRTSVSMCSLSEVQAIVAGKGHVTRVDEAMDVYQIAQFLDLPILSQGCEDIIADSINNENLISILDWSLQPHGSHWVHRQALHYLREEFVQISNSPLLYDITKHYLIEAIKSKFLQGTELDILTAVLKWAEHKLVKRMEEREPNLLTHTAHSVAKKGIKKRDMNDVELRDILSDILPYVCIDHVLPPMADVLTSMIRRGLVSTPPSHILTDDASTNQIQSWVCGKHGLYTQPRFFAPYYEEVKAVLEERISQLEGQDDGIIRMVRMSSIPDTLYMVDEHEYNTQRTSQSTPASAATVDIIAGTIPVPNDATLQAMTKHEHALQQSPLACRAYSLRHADKRAITYQIQLRVVREFGLPDSAVEVLRKKASRCDERQFDERHFRPIKFVPKATECSRSSAAPLIFKCRKKIHDGAAPASSEKAVKEAMPDIALGTASLDHLPMDHLMIQDNELTLDLGDGGAGDNNRSGTLYL